MKSNLIFFISLGILSLAISGHIFADGAAALLRHPIGARANALGSAYSGSAKDPSALLWNPAGLAHISAKKKLIRKEDKEKEAESAFEDFEREAFGESDNSNEKEEEEYVEEYRNVFEFQIFSAVSQLSLDRRIGFVGVGFPTLIGSLGFGVLGSQVEGIEGYDQNGGSTGPLEYNLYSLYAAYAMEKGPTRLGIGLTAINQNLAGKSISGAGIDIGLQFFASIFELGISIQNAGGIIQKSTSESNKFERLDTILRFSTSVQIPQTGIRIFIGMTSNLDTFENSSPALNMGLSYEIFRHTSILFGLNGGRPSLGLDLNFSFLNISYGVNRDEIGFDFQHYIDVNLKF